MGARDALWGGAGAWALPPAAPTRPARQPCTHPVHWPQPRRAGARPGAPAALRARAHAMATAGLALACTARNPPPPASLLTMLSPQWWPPRRAGVVIAAVSVAGASGCSGGGGSGVVVALAPPLARARAPATHAVVAGGRWPLAVGRARSTAAPPRVHTLTGTARGHTRGGQTRARGRAGQSAYARPMWVRSVMRCVTRPLPAPWRRVCARTHSLHTGWDLLSPRTCSLRWRWLWRQPRWPGGRGGCSDRGAAAVGAGMVLRAGWWRTRCSSQWWWSWGRLRCLWRRRRRRRRLPSARALAPAGHTRVRAFTHAHGQRRNQRMGWVVWACGTLVWCEGCGGRWLACARAPWPPLQPASPPLPTCMPRLPRYPLVCRERSYGGAQQWCGSVGAGARAARCWAASRAHALGAPTTDASHASDADDDLTRAVRRHGIRGARRCWATQAAPVCVTPAARVWGPCAGRARACGSWCTCCGGCGTQGGCADALA